MPSRRRAVLAASLAAVAGCTGPFTDSTPDDPAPGTSPGSTPAEAPDYAVWQQDLPYDDLGIVSLGGGPETPVIFAGSAAGAATTGDHALHALDLQDGTETWRVTVPGSVQTVPVYVGTDAGARFVFATGQPSADTGVALQAVDPAGPERVWQTEAASDRAVFPIATDDGRVFIGRRDDTPADAGEYVAALAAADGTEVWRTETGDVARTGTARRRDTLLVDTPERLRALAVDSGAPRWAVAADSQAYDSRAERVFVQQGAVVRGVALADGSDIWRREFDFDATGIATPRQAMDDTVFVGDPDGRLLAVSPLDGGTRWTLALDGDGGPPRVARTSERLYVAGAGLHAVDEVSGERAWSFTPTVEGRVDVATGGPSTIFAHTQRHLWALDPATGDTRWQFAPGARFAGVSAAGDFAFVGVGGTVYALDGSESA